jgi:hypothetical protein
MRTKLKGKHEAFLWRPYAAVIEWGRHLSLMGGGGGFRKDREATVIDSLIRKFLYRGSR